MPPGDLRRGGAGRPGNDSRILPAFIAALIASAPSSALADIPSFTEDFTTTAYKDSLNTTAVWDTTAGELRLSPFVPSVTGNVDTPGNAVGVAVDGDVAYVADEGGGLQVVDISDPASPAIVGSYATGANANGLFVAGNYLYLAAGVDGLLVFDVSDPTSPSLAGSYNTGDLSYDVFVSGDYAYLADWGGGLLVIDVSDPTTPGLSGVYNAIGATRRVVVDGDHAFVTDWVAGLVVIDVSDPTAPALAGSYATGGTAEDVFVTGDLAFVTDSGLYVLDISDATKPDLLGFNGSPAFARGVFVDGDRAYVSDASFGVYSIDISDPTAPSLEDSYSTPGGGWDVAIWGDHAFVADAASGLQVIAVSEVLLVPVQAGLYFSPGEAVDVATAGDHAFLADLGWGLQVIDISDPTSPTLVGTGATATQASAVAVSGNFVYVANSDSGLQVIDVTDPTTPALAGTYLQGGPDLFNDVEVDGNQAVVAANSGLILVDVSDPTTPAPLGSVSLPGPAYTVEVAGDHAFVGVNSSSGFHVVDISNPASPTDIGSLSLDPVYDIAVSGDIAVAVSQSAVGSISFVDISNPAAPSQLYIDYIYSSGDPEFPVAIDVSGDEAVVATGQRLLVGDLTDPANPVWFAQFYTSDAKSVSVVGDHAYVADGTLTGLRSVYVRQRDVTPSGGGASSLPVDDGAGAVARVRLTTPAVSGVDWYVATDAPSLDLILPGGWSRPYSAGYQLTWSAFLHWLPGGGVPSITTLTLEWLTESSHIDAITDVPDDQGGFARIGFTRSGYDFTDETSLPVTGYGIYRRVDGMAAQEVIGSRGETVDLEGAAFASFRPSSVRRLGRRWFVLGEGGPSTSGAFPAGVWEHLSFVPATQKDDYLALVPTLADSGASGTNWSVYVTTTHTTTPSIWFASRPDSGYSLDNIAPAIPAGLAFSGPGVLEWDPAPEPDFEYHTVYGSESGTFDETAVLIDYTTDSTYDVSATAYSVYHVTTSDHAGNESGAASVSSSVSIPGDPFVPAAFSMRAARPNPFRAGTSIAFDLPGPEAVRLVVFDASGRRVRQLVNRSYGAGRHRVPWDGTDRAGRAVPSGIYFARITAGTFVASQRLVAVR